jgi:hypothetical protein
MSYDASDEIKSEKLGEIEVSLYAGSYNPGSQPEYGCDWEYYHADVTKWDETSGCGNIVEDFKSGSRLEAEKVYVKMAKKYLGKVLEMPILKVGDEVNITVIKTKDGYRAFGHRDREDNYKAIKAKDSTKMNENVTVIKTKVKKIEQYGEEIDSILWEELLESPYEYISITDIKGIVHECGIYGYKLVKRVKD